MKIACDHPLAIKLPKNITRKLEMLENVLLQLQATEDIRSNLISVTQHVLVDNVTQLALLMTWNIYF